VGNVFEMVFMFLILEIKHVFNVFCRTVASCNTIAGSKRRSLLMAGDDDEMFMIRSFNVTTKTTEQHFIVRSDKYVAY